MTIKKEGSRSKGEKNQCGKTVTIHNPYEVWMRDTVHGPWTWKILKKYQSEENEKKNEYARWYCFVTSPIVPEGEYGDTYVKDIKSHAIRIK